MTDPPLSWSYAGRADIGEMQLFVCAQPAPRPNANTGWRRVPPRPCESHAEKTIRRLGPSRHRKPQGERVLIGRDDSGVACVVAWEWPSDDILYINVAGIALRLRGASGHQYSRAMVNAVLAEATSEAIERRLSTVWVTASIHEDNRASEAFAARYGLGPMGETDDHGYRIWTAPLSV